MADLLKFPKLTPLRAVVGFFAIWYAWDSVSPKRYTVDGWCLTHDRGAVELASRSAFESAIPIFGVPYDDSLAPIIMTDGGRGLAISYYKQQGQSYQNFQTSTEPWGGSYWGECPRTPLENGLSRIERVTSEHCIERSVADRYIPTEKLTGFGSISISCLPDDANVNCRMSAILQNNWMAIISLPKVMLGDWRTVAVRSRDFFSENLRDCGK